MDARVLGTMIVHGFPRANLDDELDLAEWMGARTLEILPSWRRLPDPASPRVRAADRGITVHGVHGCWGRESIRAERVDLGSPDPAVHRDSIDDLTRCVDWAAAAGARVLVVHPGGLSDPTTLPARRDALGRGLAVLSDRAAGTGVLICVENMPPGVHPGSRMEDLAELLRELSLPGVRLAIDTGHANITNTAAGETLAAGDLLATTHVHDNNGRSDSHHPPGLGTVDWPAWFAALDAINYRGPIMLECVKRVRADRSCYRPEVLAPFVLAPRQS